MSDEELKTQINSIIEGEYAHQVNHVMPQLLQLIRDYGWRERLDELKKLPKTVFNDSGNAFDAIDHEDVEKRIAELQALARGEDPDATNAS